MALRGLKGKPVFGLDIGTRSIVGTVGYKEKDRFIVLAQSVMEHETRAMLDGQIHDIAKVGETIAKVKADLEEQLHTTLSEVCIAAAGRVLRCVTTHVTQPFSEEKNILEEDVYSLSAMGVEKAYSEFTPMNESGIKFYCVGYSIIRYFVNGFPMGNPIDHKASSMEADMIVTFLPEDVVDGLYKAVEYAGLTVANLTLEPIAAIQVAIPEKFRMLNIALVDVGAGTSDISITNDGAIVAYGMIPIAGDSLTEVIAKHCLVDFNTAEQIKRQIPSGDSEDAAISFTDIMGLPQSVSSKELVKIMSPLIEDMTKKVADCIKVLNGDKSVSAVFVVGGGGTIWGYTQALAKQLDIVKERVAVRGSDVMGFVDFPEGAMKDSIMVTPIGICLSFYVQNNNFIFVSFNGKRVKLYDNGKISVVDAAMQAEFPNDGLFPKRGEEIVFTVDGKSHMKRGEFGEASVITVNGNLADIHTEIKANDVITVTPSTKGAKATQEIGTLAEYHQSIHVKVCGKEVILPKFAKVNGMLESEYYEIKNGDNIEILNYYTVSQVLEFMDIILPEDTEFEINHIQSNRESLVYERFELDWKSGQKVDSKEIDQLDNHEVKKQNKEEIHDEKKSQDEIHVIVNKQPLTLKGKSSYVYVDVFDYINFDLSKPQGGGIVTNLNGQPAEYLREIVEGDVIDIYWKN